MRALCEQLQTAVDRGRDDEAAGKRPEHGARLFGREVGGVAVGRLLDRRRRQLGRMRLGRVRRRGVDHPEVDHGIEADPGALLRFLERSGRRKARRRLDQARQHGRLGEAQLLDRLAEIASAGGIDPIGAGPEVDRVEIAGQDLLLGQAPLEPDREHDLLELAREAALRREEQVLGELLRDRAAALDHAASLQVGEGGAHDPSQIKAGVLEEPPVLHRQDGVDQMAGHL